MATAQLGAVVRHIRDLAADPKRSEQTDGALLRAFLAANDQGAFEALLRRHGPMVLRLATTEPRAAEVVKLRYYAGLTVAECATALGISPRTADNDWAYARAWLGAALQDEG
jgi:hypothetical protein